MSIRTRPYVLASMALLLTAALGYAAPVSAATAWTTPRHIPGTNGLANPIGATAPNGTDVVIWLEGTGVQYQNDVHARVRLPGRLTWRVATVRLRGIFLQDLVVVPTAGGDFWAAYQRNLSNGNTEVFVSKLDSETLRWSDPQRVFDQPDYQHAGASIGRADDGTLVVAAYAPPKVPPPGDPVYRVAVATKAPGGTWHDRFLSGSHSHAGDPDVSVNPSGDIVVSFIQGYDLDEMTVRAATRKHTAGSDWKVRTLSDPGDAQRAFSAIGDDGTAAVVWSASSASPMTIRLSTMDTHRSLDPWVGRDVATASVYLTDPRVVVTHTGRVLVVWRRGSGSATILWSRYLVNNDLREPVRLSPEGRVAVLDTLVMRPDGRAALLYHLYTTGIVSLGLRFRTLANGVPGSTTELTGDEATDGDANSESLGIDSHSHGVVIYTRGTYPDTDFAWLGQEPVVP